MALTSQLKWVLIQKPQLRNEYIDMKLDKNLLDVINESNRIFDEFSDEYLFVFE